MARDPVAHDERAVVLEPPPPPAVLKAMNVVMRPVLASRLGRSAPGLMLLEFHGRSTGRLLRVPVNFHLVGGRPMAFTDAPWRLNLAGGAPVTVTHRGRVHRTHATLVPVTSEQMAAAVLASLGTGGSAQRMGLRIRRGHQVSLADLSALGTSLGTSVIAFDVGS